MLPFFLHLFWEMLRVSRWKAILRETETKCPWSMAAKVSSFTAVPAHRRLWGSQAVFGAVLRGMSAWNSAIQKGLLGGSCLLRVFEGPPWFEWRKILHVSWDMTLKEGQNPKSWPVHGNVDKSDTGFGTNVVRILFLLSPIEFCL